MAKPVRSIPDVPPNPEREAHFGRALAFLPVLCEEVPEGEDPVARQVAAHYLDVRPKINEDVARFMGFRKVSHCVERIIKSAFPVDASPELLSRADSGIQLAKLALQRTGN